jgi:hypothetical protein
VVPEHGEGIAEAAAEIGDERVEHRTLVVDREQDRPLHEGLRWAGTGSGTITSNSHRRIYSRTSAPFSRALAITVAPLVPEHGSGRTGRSPPLPDGATWSTLRSSANCGF